MAFPEKLLGDGEEVVLDTHPHWAPLAVPAAVLVAGLVATGVLVGLDASLTPWLGVALAVLGALWLAARWLRWATTTFTVTTERLVHRTGVVAKNGMEIPLERVNNIAFAQTAFERLIGKGDLLIESGGEQGQQRFYDIPRPSAVQAEIYRQMEAAAARDAARVGGGGKPSLADELHKLDELRRRGVLSEDEFAAQKARLLEG